MPGKSHRGDLRPRRRRRDDDDGEEEGSTVGDLDNFSVSEGSAISHLDDDADGDVSDVSVEDDVSLAAADTSAAVPAPDDGLAMNKPKTHIRPEFGTFTSTADTEAMLNGLRAAGEGSEELHFDHIQDASNGNAIQVDHVDPASSLSETVAQRSKREHLEYLKERDSNPAFVPNRGGFFLHDDRSGAGPAFQRPYQRGRGRGAGPGYGMGRGYAPVNEATDRQWAHDLHDVVNRPAPLQPHRINPSSSQIPTAKPAAQPPNRDFSITTVLGNVTVQVSLPDVEQKKTFTDVVKKQYTLLPQHRPPLRRDKPVRISIPDEPPHFIFPSTERSFIFIPRAMRPNQQSFSRGRGRGSFQGSRRPSMFGGSAYTPSIGMSRKSSISGVPTNGLHTPTESMMRGGLYPANVPRPVVRMPFAPLPMAMMQHPYMPMSAGPQTPTLSEHGGPGPAILQSPLTTLPMYQPQPQKAVSLTDIEAPGVKGMQQPNPDQPFHQQMPTGLGYGNNATHPSQAGRAPATPLSHIPEGAVYAQPFQPFPMYPPVNYYNGPYSGAPMYYQPTTDGMTYMPMGGPVMAPNFVPGAQPAPYLQQPQPNDGNQSQVAHETNGMVYYYNQGQYGSDTAASQYPGGGMMASNQYYYPSMLPQAMYYPPSGGQ